MSAATPTCPGSRYGIERVCRVLEFPRPAICAKRAGESQKAIGLRRKRRGPEPKVSDERLLETIRADLAGSPFVGQGDRKPWAWLPLAGIRFSRARVLRLMRDNQLLSSHRWPQGKRNPRDGSIMIEQPEVKPTGADTHYAPLEPSRDR